MPSIAGIVYPTIFQTEKLVDVMLGTMEHRGGKKKETHSYKNVEIGISGGNISSNDRQTIFVMIDGTIYNETNLRSDLKSAGYSCSKESTAKILVLSYELWGNDFIQKLNGSFVITIFDQNAKSLLLIRDRIGKKPLYWSNNQNHFIFSSEIKGIISTGIVAQAPSLEAISAYLFFGYIPQDMCPIKGVNKLLPGYYLQYNLDGKISIHSYWSLSSYFMKPTHESEDDIMNRLDNLLLDSIKIRMPEECKVSCFLDGKIDSSSVAYYLHKLADEKKIALHGHTVKFKSKDQADTEDICFLAEKLKIPIDKDFIDEDNIFKDLIKIVWFLDEPIADPQISLTWRLCKMASEQSQTVFSSMGSEELFGSHTRYLQSQKTIKRPSLLNILPNSLIRHLLPFIKALHSKTAFSILRKFHTDPEKLYYLTQNAIFNSKEISFISPTLSQYFNSMVFLQKFYQLVQLEPGMDSLLYFDIKTALPDKRLLQFERFTSAYQISWRTPFLDHRIIEYLVGIPYKSKSMKDRTAFPLRKLMENAFPASFIYREEQTRREYFKDWLKKKPFKEMFPWIEGGVLSESGFISSKKISGIINKQKNQEKQFQQLWSILILEIWFRLFINKPTGSLSNIVSQVPFQTRTN